MSILEIKNLTHRYDDRFLFENASLTVNNGEHIGVVGLNGAGKSTFINIIAGRLTQDEGEVNYLKGIRYGYLDQFAAIDKNLTVTEYLSDAFSYLYEKENELNSVYEKMGEADGAELERLIKISDRLQTELNDENFYDLQSEIKKVANGLGVNKFGYDAVIGNLSGGERAKLMLAKLLLQQQDLMLLDEPTNYLDIEHVNWLIKFLNSYKKTFLVISHDTIFLDSVCKVIVSIENCDIKRYNGNYSQYLVQREEYARQYSDKYKAQQAEIKRLNEYIERNKARAATAKMAHSREKTLAKMEVLSKPAQIFECRFSFPYTDIKAKEFVKINDLTIGYGVPLIKNININLTSGDKLWIRGTNGVGKTTLLKTLVRKIKPIKGSFFIHPEAKILYLEQELYFENDNDNAAAYYSAMRPADGNKQVRSALAEAGIKGDLATKPLKKLSGGEQVRVRLSVLTKSSSNLLILDEPTNHLDAVAKKALADALTVYEGTVILVTHEADFAQKICNKIFDAKS